MRGQAVSERERALPLGVSYVEVAASADILLCRHRTGQDTGQCELHDFGQCNVLALPPGSSYVEIAAGGNHSVARLGPASPVVYCTAKTNSAGCVPAIAFSGSPSASAGSGFLIQASMVLDLKFGLLFYGKNGPASSPFQGGTLCATPPLTGTPIQNSGGTPPCDGTYSFDFNTFIASGQDPALVAGQMVNAQYWSRDPGLAPPNNTGLTDAIDFTLAP
jgi:hypothetical protein